MIRLPTSNFRAGGTYPGNDHCQKKDKDERNADQPCRCEIHEYDQVRNPAGEKRIHEKIK